MHREIPFAITKPSTAAQGGRVAWSKALSRLTRRPPASTPCWWRWARS